MIQTNKTWNDFDKLSQHNGGGVGNRTIASLFEMQGAPSAVNMLLLKISICSFYQHCSSTLASQEISGVWFFKKTCGCSALQGGEMEKKRKKEAGTEEVFVSSGFQFRHLWLMVQLCFFAWARGNKSTSSSKASSIFIEFVQFKESTFLQPCSSSPG